MLDNEKPEDIRNSYKKAESITKGTAVSLSVVVIIVVGVMYIVDIRGSSDANAKDISENARKIRVIQKNAIEAQRTRNALLNDINTRLSRMEGILKSMDKGDK